MADFNADHKKEMGAYFSEGVHKVKITDITAGDTDSGKEYFEFKVEGENGEEGSARMWWSTDKAIGYSFNTVKGIFVHNTVEKNRDQVREMLDKCKNTEELFEVCHKSLIGKECWYSTYKSDRTYVNGAGETKHSYDTNVYGYEPKPQAKSDNILNDIANGTPVDTNSDEIPFE